MNEVFLLSLVGAIKIVMPVNHSFTMKMPFCFDPLTLTLFEFYVDSYAYDQKKNRIRRDKNIAQ
ncbi:hypothetical protein THO17_23980 [Marinomonas sp. THO17]